jgi:enoyl-CoA hydratase
MSSDATRQVLLDHDDGVSTVTLNRPEILNAIDADMTAELIGVLRLADAEPTTGCIVLRGAGRAFCSGGNVGNMGGVPAVERVLHRDWHLLNALHDTEKVIIGMVHGAAVGLGATIALSCDLTYVADDARIGDTHVVLGILAGDGAMIPLLVNAGPTRAKEFLLLGKIISGAEAFASHLVTRALAPDELAASTYAVAREIASRPSYAVRASKAVLNRQARWATHHILEPSLAFESHSMQMSEHLEAVREFQEQKAARRSPQ